MGWRGDGVAGGSAYLLTSPTRVSRMTQLTRSQVAQMVDHTLLKPEATAVDVRELVADGERLGVSSVGCFISLKLRNRRK